MSLNRCPGITFIIEKDAHHWIMTFDKKSKGRYNFRDAQKKLKEGIIFVTKVCRILPDFPTGA